MLLELKRERYTDGIVKVVYSNEVVKTGTLSQLLTRGENQYVYCVLKYIKNYKQKYTL